MLKNAQTTQPHVMASTMLCYVLVTSVWNREDPCSILLAWPQAAWESATLTALSALFRAAAAAKSLQSCPTLCDPIDGSPPGSPIPGILQARTLESVAISFSSAWHWKVKVKSLSHLRPSATPWTTAFQAPPSMGFSRQEYWSGVALFHAY